MTESAPIITNRSENVIREPIRPLGKISDFVVEILPIQLEAVREGRLGIDKLSGTIRHLLIDADAGAIGSFITGRDREIALLDLLCMQSALGNSGGEIPEALTDVIGHLASKEGRPPILTYEDVILINPLDTDPRMFTRGSVGGAELFFYKTHRNIEEAGLILNELVRSALCDLGEGNIADAKFLLEQCNLPSAMLLQEMFGLKALDPEDFAKFRTYFGGYPKGNKGPSGAFSPAIATLDVLLSGRELPEDRRAYHRDNSMYFPREGQREIQAAYTLVLNSKALDEYRGIDEEIDQHRSGLHQFLTTFRSAHHGRVGEQIPKALEGTISGTGGEINVGEFLRERIQFNKSRRSI